MTTGDVALDVTIVVAIALVVTAGAYAASNAISSVRIDAPEESTPVARPVVNPANGPLVSALYAASAGIEASSIRVAGGLLDVARAVQLETKTVDPKIKDRTATFIEEYALDVSREGLAIREA